MKESFRSWFPLAVVASAALLASPASAAIIAFDLVGKGGVGLLGSNENGVIVNPGSGGEVQTGIRFDTVDSRLYIVVGWGSGKGFTDLSGPAIAQHIHGPTPSGGVGSFTENSGILFGLDPLAFIVDPSATNGGINGSAPLTAQQVTELFAGQYYVNVHTAANPNGEIRGNLTMVPEPAVALLAFLAMGRALMGRRR